MLYAMLCAMLAACSYATLVFVLAVPRAAKAHRLARLFRAQQKWADMMDRHDTPADDNAVTIVRNPSAGGTPLAGSAPARTGRR